MKTRNKIILGVIGLIILILLLAPFAIRKYITKNSKNIIGRKLELKSLWINPFTGRLSAKGFKLYELNDSSIFIGFERFKINTKPVSYLWGKVNVQSLLLDNPIVNIEFDNGEFNFGDLVSETDTTESENKTNKTIKFVLHKINLLNGQVSFKDVQLEHEVNINNISFIIPELIWNKENTDLVLNMNIGESGKFYFDNRLIPIDSSFSSAVRLSGISLDIVRPYLLENTNLTDVKGTIGCELFFNGNFTSETEIFIEGNTWITDLEVRDTSKTPLFKMDSVGVSLKKLDLVNEQYLISSATLEKLLIRFDMADSTNSVSDAFLIQNMEVTEDSVIVDTNKSNLFFRIDSLLIADAAVLYRDVRFQDLYEYELTDIYAHAENISSDSTFMELFANGSLNRKGTFFADLNVNTANPMDFDMEFTIDGFNLQDVSPFSIYYAGHPIFEGDLIYKGSTTSRSGQLNSQNSIKVYDLIVGDKINGNALFAMPLKFGVFLLKDKNGIVNLDIPVSGNLNDPKFKIGPIIWKILKQNMEKVVAAPGKFLAAAFGIDPDKIRRIDFSTLNTELSEDAIETILLLKELIDKKEGLLVQLDYIDHNPEELYQLANFEMKKEYALTRLHAESISAAYEMAGEIQSSDNYYLDFLLAKTDSVQSSNADSIAYHLVSTEVLLNSQQNLRNKRISTMKNYFNSNYPELDSNLKMTINSKIPEEPVTSSGFIIYFDMLPD